MRNQPAGIPIISVWLLVWQSPCATPRDLRGVARSLHSFSVPSAAVSLLGRTRREYGAMSLSSLKNGSWNNLASKSQHTLVSRDSTNTLDDSLTRSMVAAHCAAELSQVQSGISTKDREKKRCISFLSSSGNRFEGL
jgi:hypothetical protein